jgi:hypothetical protein
MQIDFWHRIWKSFGTTGNNVLLARKGFLKHGGFRTIYLSPVVVVLNNNLQYPLLFMCVFGFGFR